MAEARWRSICKDCAGAIDSLVELLKGRFSQSVMERVCRQKTGLFPSPGEIKLTCSCPDWADMCKHVAAVLYRVGARLDEQPELLFRLHRVDEKDLIAKASAPLPLVQRGPATSKILDGEDLAELFALDMARGTDAHASLSDNVRPNKRGTPPPRRTESAAKAADRNKPRTRTMKKGRSEQRMKAWDDARKRHHLSHAQVQMARELGMNPAKLGKIDNHKQEPWKLPLPEFIEELYVKRFGRTAHRALAANK